MRLAGKVALVTGASRGIGLGIAERFAEEGAIVYAGSTSNPSGVYPPGVTGLRLDVTSEDDWKTSIGEILAKHGRIDVLVNNAGIIVYDSVHDLSLADWNKVIAVNQTGVFLGMREVIPAMRTQKAGSIINVSSIWGIAAVAGAHVYHATKGAVGMMSKNAAMIYVADGIRVNSLHPGFIDTPLTQSQDKDMNAFVVASTPMKRAGTPREIANGALFLACDESSFMTGAELVIDGGYLAQ
ncbi:SDR family NAD(P)-dependent oxidoreductase [Segnochrobactrum spirostomi]|uniref:SDR family oxidoreductase n=1 Tax=Segnochrobactrum spirostomi TaxID=2608987 RepID=A0A6A7Y7S3_9HYPH|nr:SDR family oxidoreductase [Segnochrobactrum spirostomi]MQT14896.1 SDR family oxidoreductase [Segnochrobactrum spirostomi]